MVVSLDCGDEAAQAAALLGRKRFRGKYRGTTMEANKRDWNSVVKSSKSQVRQTDQVWFHCQLQASSLAGDLQWHSCPLLVNRWWYKWQVDRLDETLGPGVDTHTHNVTMTSQNMTMLSAFGMSNIYNFVNCPEIS